MAELKYLTIEHLPLKYIIRIFSKIRVNTTTGCWEWTDRLVNGYGQFRYGKTQNLAHRFVFAWLVGPIPKGQGKHVPQLDHEVCNMRHCVNPAHLNLKTPQANTLRSRAPSALNAIRTHCIHGHLLPIEPNTKRASGHWRRCIPCDRERTQKWRTKNPDFGRTDEARRKKREYRHRKGISKTYSKKYQPME